MKLISLIIGLALILLLNGCSTWPVSHMEAQSDFIVFADDGITTKSVSHSHMNIESPLPWVIGETELNTSKDAASVEQSKNAFMSIVTNICSFFAGRKL